MVHFYSL